VRLWGQMLMAKEWERGAQLNRKNYLDFHYDNGIIRSLISQIY
jgi:hypothetical protein